ncbi:DUF6506 family protein [Desulfotruncus alcoholivorax]|uniref:DUF6506 family protein n=1 Tax=Desulfotruncus alcoholivorax TaxID=265477 RepID=UPI0009D7798B|nr:DUF6506 family protein [Desulfotruncus alcoholivorax]
MGQQAYHKDYTVFFTTVTLPTNLAGICNHSIYQAAEEAIIKLVAEGVKAIELCGGFGHEGVARAARAAGRGVAVGAVRFDAHPGLNGNSGDAIF